MQHLRLRDQASLLVLSVGVVIGALVTLIVLLQHLQQQESDTAQGARAAQLSLEGFSLAIAGQRIAVPGYLVTGDSQFLDSYNAGREEAIRSGGELARRATSDGVDIGPLRDTTRNWQTWADGAVSRTPGPGATTDLDQGRRLLGAVEVQEQQVNRKLDAAAALATSQADARSAFLAIMTPSISALLLALLLFLWWQVVSSILKPIDQLADTARSISRGEGPEIPGLERQDELGQLAQALAAWRREASNRLELANAVAVEKERQARTLGLPAATRATSWPT
jgi:methyl-accepting chemotaxis protein